MNLIRSIAGFIIAALLAGVAVFNRQNIEFFFSPLHEPFVIPLYGIVLGFFGAGFLVGGFIVWMNGGQTRQLTRQQRKQIKALKQELDVTKNETAPPHKPWTEFFPALRLPRT